MIKPVTTFSYIKGVKTVRYLCICVGTLLLSGCLGGTVAQQIARSIATSIADIAVANALDVNEETQPRQKESIALTNRPPSTLALAIRRTSFKAAEPTKQDFVKEPNEKEAQTIESNALAHVKVFNTIIGKEKDSYYEQARLVGALNLPQEEEWQNWHIATGEIIHNKTYVTFIVPPTLGKPVSGSTIVVEMANVGDINIARYHDNVLKMHQAMDDRSAAFN